MAGKEFIILQKENILQTQGGMGILWYYKRKFKDFILDWNGRRLVREIIQESLLGSQILRNDPYVAVGHGYEIKLMILLSQMISLFMALGQFMILRLHPQ